MAVYVLYTYESGPIKLETLPLDPGLLKLTPTGSTGPCPPLPPSPINGINLQLLYTNNTNILHVLIHRDYRYLQIFVTYGICMIKGAVEWEFGGIGVYVYFIKGFHEISSGNFISEIFHILVTVNKT